MQTQVFYTKHQSGITAFVNGVPVVIDQSNPNFDLIESDLKAKNYDRILKLANSKVAITSAIEQHDSTSRIYVKNGQIFWKGTKGDEQLEGSLVDRIVSTIRDGSTTKSIQPLIALMGNIEKNKKKDIRQELYEFMMSGKMPITQDGCFLAYKKVKSDFKDIYTGNIDNSPGKLVAMDEQNVDPNRNNLCSTGLHFCSRSYLSSYGVNDNSVKTVIVKVNPRHVFAIPTDYQNAKGRASEYYVVGLATGNAVQDEHFLKSFIFDDDVKSAAPQVKFVEKSKKNPSVLKPGLKTIGEGYGYIEKGRVRVRFMDTKHEFESSKYSVVFKKNDEWISAITGKPVPEDHTKELSWETKTVRSALIRAVARRRNA